MLSLIKTQQDEDADADADAEPTHAGEQRGCPIIMSKLRRDCTSTYRINLFATRLIFSISIIYIASASLAFRRGPHSYGESYKPQHARF
jgi:hypothetical protein